MPTAQKKDGSLTWEWKEKERRDGWIWVQPIPGYDTYRKFL